MRYLIDTDWVVDYLRGRAAAMRLLASFANDELFISPITHGEIYDGIEQSADPIAAQSGYQRFLIDISIVPVDEEIVRRFFRVRRQLRQAGTPLEDLDLMIAATALHHDLTLVTRNRRHYDRIQGLKLYP